jgi:hypothetical protein
MPFYHRLPNFLLCLIQQREARERVVQRYAYFAFR